MDFKKQHLCSECGKEYKHRQNLYRHIKIKHKKEDVFPTFSNLEEHPKNTLKTPLKTPQNTPKKVDIKCKYCDKTFAFNQGKYRHQKKCKYNKTANYISKEEHIKEIQNLKEELIEQFTKLIKDNYEPKTQEIRSIGNIGNQLNDHAIGTQNNIVIQLGKEDVLGTLTFDDKLGVLDERYNSVIELIKLMHCSDKYPQFNNSIINNLKSEFALTYSEEEEKFVTTNKNNLVSDIVSYRTENVNEILEENKDKVSKRTKQKVKEVVNILGKDDDILNNDENQYVKEYNTKVMTSIYDKRKELKKRKKDLL